MKFTPISTRETYDSERLQEGLAENGINTPCSSYQTEAQEDYDAFQPHVASGAQLAGAQIHGNCS